MQRRLLAIRILAVVALLLAAYLAWTTLSESGLPAGCDEEGSGCGEVLTTRWSQWFGLPVSAAGALIYAALVWLAFTTSPSSPPLRWQQLAFISATAAAAGVWFTILQLFIIRSVCYYCTAVHICGIIIAAMVFTASPETSVPGKKGKPKKAEPVRLGKAALLGLVGVVVLAGGQLFSMRAPALPAATEARTTNAPATQSPPKHKPTQGEVLLAKGRLRLGYGDFPAIGPQNARRTVVMMYDYTCPACRALHPQLMLERSKYGKEAAIMLIPMPLDSLCNPGVKETTYQHRDACEFARIGLILWSIQPESFYRYDEFMFKGQYPPTIQQAKQFADNLVGVQAMNAALSDPHYDQLISYGVQLFNSSLVENKVLPTLITPETVSGGIPPPEQLQALFR